MKLLITGGGGFVGARLAARPARARHARRPARSSASSSTDQVAPPPPTCSPTRASRPASAPLLGAVRGARATKRFDGVFHLASAVSGECEADFDLGLRSNLDTTRALLDALRAASAAGGKAPARLVFSSSVAVFGPDPSVPLPPLVADDTLPAPKTSYGTHKLICEHLIADYSRKGYIDGRSARLMTVTVRPGRPNGAASSFFSGIIREPLAGVESICPVSPDVSHAGDVAGAHGRGPDRRLRGERASARRPARRSTCRRSTCTSPTCSTRSRKSPARRCARACASSATRRIAGIVANWPKRRDRGARGAARPARRQELRRHHPPVHRRLPRRPGRGAVAQGPCARNAHEPDRPRRAASPSSPAARKASATPSPSACSPRARRSRCGTPTPPSSPRPRARSATPAASSPSRSS